MGEDRRRIHCRVSGKVQGVWYRASTQREAAALGVSGWVRNLEDGRVELVAEGPSDAVGRLEAWLRTGPPHAHVERVDVREERHSGRANRKRFEILY